MHSGEDCLIQSPDSPDYRSRRSWCYSTPRQTCKIRKAACTSPAYSNPEGEWVLLVTRPYFRVCVLLDVICARRDRALHAQHHTYSRCRTTPPTRLPHGDRIRSDSARAGA
eukprot:scaffold25100_cov68-Phaeocystis_antarctica.AAC.5